MGFQVDPKAAPTHLNANSAPHGQQPPSGESARDRAINRLLGKGPEDTEAPASAQVETQDKQGVSKPEDTVNQPKIEQNNTNVSASGEKSPTESDNKGAEATKPEAQDKYAQQMALLARKEKALRIDNERRNAQIKELEAKLKQIEEAQSSKFIPKEKLSKEHIVDTLREAGMSYEDITEAVLNAPKANDLASSADLERRIQKAIEEAVNPIKSTLEQSKKEQEEAQQAQYEQALNGMRVEAKRLVKSDDNFEAIALEGDKAIDEVVGLIEHVYHNGLGEDMEPGYIMSVEQAAQLVEAELVSRYQRAMSLKKLQGHKQEPPKEESKGESQESGIKTLTNNNSSTPKMSDRERAIAAFEGRLNKDS